MFKHFKMNVNGWNRPFRFCRIAHTLVKDNVFISFKRTILQQYEKLLRHGFKEEIYHEANLIKQGVS